VKRFLDVARAVAWRSTKHFFGNPAFLVPAVMFPVFFLAAFAGGLSSVDDVPAFDYEPGYTTFQFVFVLLQASAFGGVFTGIAIAADFESGFARRLMLAAPNRVGILAGYVISALVRTAVVATIVSTVATLGGMRIEGGVVDVFGLAVLALLVTCVGGLFGAGVAFRARTVQAGPAMQLPIFAILFLAPVYVPRELLQNWIETAAGLNPFTPIVEAGRNFLAGRDTDVALAFGMAAGLVALMLLFALRGLRKAEAAGG
jgi:ABC-2 type transport system permease protein